MVLFNEGAESSVGLSRRGGHRPAASGTLRERGARQRRRCARCASAAAPPRALKASCRAKDGSSIPVLISASVLFGEEGEEVGTVGFATDLRSASGPRRRFSKAHDELEKRVEERTTELKAAPRADAVPDDGHAWRSSTPTRLGQLHVHVRQRECLPDHGLFRRGRCSRIQSSGRRVFIRRMPRAFSRKCVL